MKKKLQNSSGVLYVPTPIVELPPYGDVVNQFIRERGRRDLPAAQFEGRLDDRVPKQFQFEGRLDNRVPEHLQEMWGGC